MTIEQLKSGSYRIKQMHKGKTYRITIDHKPTQREAKQIIQELIENDANVPKAFTFEDAANKYIEVKSNVLSPSTIVGYKKILRWISDDFKRKALASINQTDIQVEVNLLAADHSPKSVRNTHGFISAVFRLYRPNMVIHTTLPQKLVNEAYMPSDEDIKKLLKYCEDGKYEIAIKLALLGLRRSEVIALQYPQDLNGNILTVNKAIVKDANGEYVVKTTKTVAGTREIYLPDDLVTLIHNRGKFYEGHAENIWKYLDKAQKDLGLPHFKLHTLRHYYASTAHALGVPDAYIMSAGGWASDTTLKQVYRHSLDDKKREMEQIVAQYISNLG